MTSSMGSIRPVIAPKAIESMSFASPIGIQVVVPRSTSSRAFVLRASMVNSYENSSNFVQRMEKAWLISQLRHEPFRYRVEQLSLSSIQSQTKHSGRQQPRPVGCSSCNSNGHVECKWCGGTGFFVLGDNMLCQVSSRNSNCVICGGVGSTCCSDCKGTGFRAKWLGEPPISK